MQLDHKEQQEPRELLDRVGRQVHKETQVFQELQDQVVQQVHKVLQVQVVGQVGQELRDNQAQLDQMVLKEGLDQLDLQVMV